MSTQAGLTARDRRKSSRGNDVLSQATSTSDRQNIILSEIISEALFREARGFLISCTKSVEKFSVAFIRLLSSFVISSKDFDSTPSSSFLFLISSILVSFLLLDLIIFV